MNFKTIFLPNQEHFLQIKEWLNEEDQNTGDGFLCNWDVIAKAFNENRLIVLTENDFAIGFLVYRKSDLILNIVIAEIKPSHRKKGLGKLLINDSLENFRNQGLLVSELSCSPASSERIWLKLGFTNFPDSPKWNGEILMFKTLVDSLNPIIPSKLETDKITLWDCRVNFADRFEPIAEWNLKFKDNSRELKKPIIFPAHYKWQLTWKENGKIIFKNGIDRMSSKIDHGNFIIITELKI